MFNIIQWKRKGGITAAVGTVIRAMLDPGVVRGRVIVTRLAIQTGATAQTLSVMQVLSKHRAGADALATQKVIQVAEGNAFAANDLLAIKMPNGNHELYTVASVGALANGLYPVTLAENLSAPIPKGAAICFFGVPGDGHEAVAIPASATTVLQSDEGYFGANEMGEPIILSLTNATNAATIQAVNYPIITV